MSERRRYFTIPDRLLTPTPRDVEFARARLNIRVTLPPQVTVQKSDILTRDIAPVAVGELGHKPLPGTGLWTSTYTPNELSGWLQWCAESGFSPGWERPEAFILRPRACRILVVATVEDLEAIMTIYADRRSPMWENGIYSLSPIDFPALARDFDALHLTDDGQAATRFSTPFSLYGWDCESTIWFRWMFDDDVRYVRTDSLIPASREAPDDATGTDER